MWINIKYLFSKLVFKIIDKFESKENIQKVIEHFALESRAKYRQMEGIHLNGIELTDAEQKTVADNMYSIILASDTTSEALKNAEAYTNYMKLTGKVEIENE